MRKANFYGVDERNVTPFGMTVEDNIAPALVERLERTSRYRERREALAGWNRLSPVIKRGIALTPVKFGISFTATHYNQAGALLHLYADGTLLLNHGGTERGQGLFTKVARVAARACTAAERSAIATACHAFAAYHLAPARSKDSAASRTAPGIP